MVMDWSNSVIHDVHEILSQIITVWNETGLKDVELTDRKANLKHQIFAILTGKLSEEKNEKKKLIDSITQLKENILSIESELSLPSEEVLLNVPLRNIFENLSKRMQYLDSKVAELTAEFKSLKNIEKCLCMTLGVATLTGFPRIPSTNDKVKLQSRIDELKNMQASRTIKLMTMKQRILSSMNYLGSDAPFNVSEAVELFIKSTNEPTILTDAFILKVSEVKNVYLDTCKKLKFEEDEINDKIKSMRNRLALSPFIIPSDYSKSPSARIQYGKQEVDRLRVLRQEHILNFIEKCVIEIEEVWTSCSVGANYRATFRDNVPKEFNDETLSILEDEIVKWQHFKAMHVDFYATLSVWTDTLKRIKAIEIQRQDPIVLKNRGGILLKLDKEDRRLRQRDLPQHTSLLESLIKTDGQDAHLFSVISIEGQNSASPLSDLRLATSAFLNIGGKENTDKCFDVLTFQKSAVASTSMKRSALTGRQSPLQFNSLSSPAACSSTKKRCLFKK